MWKFISNEPNENEYHSETININNDKIQNKNRSITKKYIKHTIQIKWQKSVDYSEK